MRVVDHHSDWRALATDACRQVKAAVGDLLIDVQHAGSAAVPDLPAKPISDLAAAAAAAADARRSTAKDR